MQSGRARASRVSRPKANSLQTWRKSTSCPGCEAPREPSPSKRSGNEEALSGGRAGRADGVRRSGWTRKPSSKRSSSTPTATPSRWWRSTARSANCPGHAKPDSVVAGGPRTSALQAASRPFATLLRSHLEVEERSVFVFLDRLPDAERPVIVAEIRARRAGG